MKVALLLFGLSSIAAANPLGESLLSRAVSNPCTNGVQNPDDGPCSYTVTCNSLGISNAAPLQQQTATSITDCLSDCTAYGMDTGTPCQSVNYDAKSKVCQLFAANNFSKTKSNKHMYDYGVLYGCG